MGGSTKGQSENHDAQGEQRRVERINKVRLIDSGGLEGIFVLDLVGRIVAWMD